MHSALTADPYRCPPVTGPTTRAQKTRAKFGLWIDPVADWIAAKPMLSKALGAVITIFGPGVVVITLGILCCDPPPDKHWLIECQDRKSWTAPHVYLSSGRTVTTDSNGNRVYLAADCQATEISGVAP